MNIASLTSHITENLEWYKVRGRRFKRLSMACRGLMWLFATLSVLSMTVSGANNWTVIFALIAGSAIGFDRTFGLTRNWLEFSAAEIELRSALSQVNFLFDNGGSRDELLAVYAAAIKAVETETTGWKGDVLSGIEELRSATTKTIPKE